MKFEYLVLNPYLAHLQIQTKHKTRELSIYNFFGAYKSQQNILVTIWGHTHFFLATQIPNYIPQEIPSFPGQKHIVPLLLFFGA